MQSRRLLKFTTQCEKFILSAKEKQSLDIEDFTSVRHKDICVMTDPFPHVVIENFFKPDIYRGLVEQFARVQARGLIDEKKPNDKSRFHLFDIEYDGYVFTPPPVLHADNPLRIFYSLEWNHFFSKLFHQFTTFETSLSFHHHPKGDQTGFVHNDFVDKYFRQDIRLPNGVRPIVVDGKGGSPRKRIIAILFYLNNDGWKEGDGGETGIYGADKMTLVKKVPPLNNSLLAFRVSQASMHAFQANLKERNSLVQWLHVPEEML